MLERISFIVLAIVLSNLSCRGQDANNYIDINANTSLNYWTNSVNEIESDQTISNAITIKFKNKQKTRHVYARISSFTSPTGFSVASPYPLQLKHAYNNSSNESNLVTAALTLTNTDQRLFTQTKSSGTLFQFTYDLIFRATNWSYPPGNYNFTILFTLSPP